MMMTLTATTWLRFLIWFALGLIVYFAYGIRNSVENKNNQSCVFPCQDIKEKEEKPDDKIDQEKNEFTQL